MKFEHRFNLTAFEVEYIDTREPKPRTVHWEQIVLDGGRLSALARLGQTPAAFIGQQYEAAGFHVSSIHRGETVEAEVDLPTLWAEIQNKKALRRLAKLSTEAAAAKEGSAAE